MSKETGVATIGTIDTFRGVLRKMAPAIESALQRRIPADYFVRVLTTTVQKTPKLLECSTASLLGAVMESAQLGLIPDGVTGYGYLVPRWNKNLRCPEAHFQAGYKGLVQLALRSERISKVVGREVREGDLFEYRFGTDEMIGHIPATSGRWSAAVTHFYAIAWQVNGPPIFVVLESERVDEIRDRATAANGGKMTPAWSGDYVAMGRKTAVRELHRWLPIDAEAARVAARDEAADADDAPAVEVPSEVVASVSGQPKAAIDTILDGDEDEPGSDPEFTACAQCLGAGVIGDEPCETCGGAGEVPRAR